jgi:hypothetical protein
MRKISEEKQKEIKLREELERMLQDGMDNLKLTLDNAKEVLPAQEKTFMNYDEVKGYSDEKAEVIVNSISEFYLNSKIITEIPYVNQKRIVDKITISNLLFQMKTAEHAIIKLLEEIDNGNLHPRSFEVLAALQRSKMEIVKHIAQFMVIMENNYKSLKEDYRIKQSDEPTISEDASVEEPSSGDHQFRGSKQLVEMLRQVVPEKKASDKPTEILNIDNGNKR